MCGKGEYHFGCNFKYDTMTQVVGDGESVEQNRYRSIWDTFVHGGGEVTEFMAMAQAAGWNMGSYGPYIQAAFKGAKYTGLAYDAMFGSGSLDRHRAKLMRKSRKYHPDSLKKYFISKLGGVGGGRKNFKSKWKKGKTRMKKKRSVYQV